MQERSSSKSSIAAFVAGSTTIMLFPLEKIKLHMIVSDKVSQNHVPYYKNSLEAFRTLKAQGIRNLYRGFHFQFTVSIA